VKPEHAERFLEVSSGLFVIGTTDGQVTWVNSAWTRQLGIPREKLLGRGYLDFVHPEDRARTAESIERGDLERAEDHIFKNRYRADDGSYRVLDWSLIADGETGLVYGVARDVTELEASRDALAASQANLTEAQRMSRLGSWTYDPPTGAVSWSDGLYRVFGVEPGEFEPSYDGHMAFVHPDSIDALKGALERCWETGEPYELDYRIIAGDGREVSLFSQARVETRDDGSRFITGVCQDVSAIRRAERDLARTVSLLEATLEATADGILVVDTDGRTVSWNHNFPEMWRLPEEVIAEREDEKMIAYVLEQLRDPDAFLARVRSLYDNPEQESFDVLDFKDGRVFERYSAPQRLGDEVVGRVWSFRDVTGRLRTERENLALEARLQQSQRLESLGRLAGGIAHDFNNHLVAILNYAALAGEELPEGASGRADLDEVIRAAERASALTRELVAFSRQEMVEPRPLLLNSLVADAERLLRRTIGEDIELRVELGRNMPAVEADPSQLERVLMNLAVNARDAMPEGGSLVISTEALERGESENGAGIEGKVVRLRVRDSGSGMSEEVARRAFEPFFTTKPSGEGTGLGLATVYGIVNQSGGQLSVDSAPGEGTTITIDLPASDKPPEVEKPTTEEQRRPVRGAVLVVEDEAPVRRLTARLLRDAGFTTLEAANGREAVAVLEETDEELRLLLTDIVMPKMSGRELAERVRGMHPDLPVLFMSGYTDDVVVRHGVATADLPFVAKPFTRDTLLKAVNEAIEAGVRPLG
jgi:two-component system, cell cycle sensor histidine kinase and response regulator CckA